MKGKFLRDGDASFTVGMAAVSGVSCIVQWLSMPCDMNELSWEKRCSENLNQHSV